MLLEIRERINVVCIYCERFLALPQNYSSYIAQVKYSRKADIEVLMKFDAATEMIKFVQNYSDRIRSMIVISSS